VLPITLFQISPESQPLGTFEKPEIKIGKRPECDVQLVAILGISGVHAVLSFAEGRWYVLDPGAAKPARLDSKVIPYNERIAIPSGSRLMLGNVVIEVTYG
jgi:hypothetical protein